jgi:hypothetical protein
VLLGKIVQDLPGSCSAIDFLGAEIYSYSYQLIYGRMRSSAAGGEASGQREVCH